ncbi:NAD(P)-binding domain-containing protein [Nannocystis sp.]|uniref:NAD(P)-binding domain-containing protein n=1 Tax=Nannocystis sp. TaxID=1962667 RepID=UPI002422FC8B|nr:NAD(P)-binding domain-containing protein [Nannocystis sp.]MBK7825949.1 NAD(P)-binding domain-containing protein [Nannocystis sp.]MBK9755516.1 NAD(P)-binding domain-containing protein [Nannocystis sp.]
MKIGVVGGGAFAWALAHAVRRTGSEVLMWSRRPQREAGAGISLVALPALAAAELIFFAVPSPVLPELARELGQHLDGGHYLVHVSRGIVGDGLMTLSQVLRSVTPCRRVGALAGPLVAAALESGAPGGGVIASRFPEVHAAVREAIGGKRLRIYSSEDVIGAEFASTAVGLLAMAVGYVQGIGLGPATLAVMASRGMAECTRIGVQLGGRVETFAGLAGHGDLLAAVAGDGRPELAVGRELAAGTLLADIRRQGGAYVEGIESARRIAAYAQRTGARAPLVSMCADVFDRKIGSAEVVELLMSRAVGGE